MISDQTCPQCALDVEPVPCPGIHVGRADHRERWLRLEVDETGDDRVLLPCDPGTDEAEQVRLILRAWLARHLDDSDIVETIDAFVDQMRRDSDDIDRQVADEAADFLDIRWKMHS